MYCPQYTDTSAKRFPYSASKTTVSQYIPTSSVHNEQHMNIYTQVKLKLAIKHTLSRGVMVIILDLLSAEPSSNPARCYLFN